MTSYIANVTLFDGARVRAKQGVLVGDDGTIAWTGAHPRAPRESRVARAIDASGKTLTPGLIDCHVHLQFDGVADFEREAREMTPTLAVLKAARNARQHLEHGVTTVRDLGGEGPISAELGKAIDQSLIPGARVRAAGHALTISGGHGHNIGVARQAYDHSPDDTRQGIHQWAGQGMARRGQQTPGPLAGGSRATGKGPLHERDSKPANPGIYPRRKPLLGHCGGDLPCA